MAECSNSDQRQHFAVFFISTGRCGTQWLASSLAEHYSDLAEVTHEPMLVPYAARALFIAHHEGKEVTLPQAVEDHFLHIEETLKTRHYIETGWPMYGALPAFLRRLKGRVKLVQLVRHPIWMAASLARHKFYQLGELTNALALTPSDHGIVQSGTDPSSWNSLPEFDKNLFWWAEQHSFGVEIRASNEDIPSTTVRFEDMFSNDPEVATSVLKALVEFLELPVRHPFLESRSVRVDKYSAYKAEDEFDLSKVAVSREVLSLSKMFKYEIDMSIGADLRRSYRRSLLERILTSGKRRVKQLLRMDN